MSARGIFASDFHMFCERSVVDSILPDLDRAAQDVDIIILGGDIVDFKWTQLEDYETTETAALTWLRSFINRHSGKQIVYLVGNHDGPPSYLSQLHQMCDSTERFEVYEYWYQRGEFLFLHGDAVHGRSTQAELERCRAKKTRHRKRGRVKNELYNLAFLLRLPSLVNVLINRDRPVCQRLVRYLQDEKLVPGRGLRRIYFGHTHAVVKGFRLDELEFYNGGAPLRTLSSEILHFEINGDFCDGK